MASVARSAPCPSHSFLQRVQLTVTLTSNNLIRFNFNFYKLNILLKLDHCAFRLCIQLEPEKQTALIERYCLCTLFLVIIKALYLHRSLQNYRAGPVRRHKEVLKELLVKTLGIKEKHKQKPSQIYQ